MLYLMKISLQGLLNSNLDHKWIRSEFEMQYNLPRSILDVNNDPIYPVVCLNTRVSNLHFIGIFFNNFMVCNLFVIHLNHFIKRCGCISGNR